MAEMRGKQLPSTVLCDGVWVYQVDMLSVYTCVSLYARNFTGCGRSFTRVRSRVQLAINPVVVNTRTKSDSVLCGPARLPLLSDPNDCPAIKTFTALRVLIVRTAVGFIFHPPEESNKCFKPCHRCLSALRSSSLNSPLILTFK
ncbi:hypothetical protein J6590_003514 [Homalodisca vitripennis]|nr:hypothetical protein J6590_003514 [Homalodisca vitripennis]